MASRKFSWFPKFTRAVERVPEELQSEMMLAIVRYGTYGTEPELSWPLDAIFESIRDDIDNSVQASSNGSRGGRGNRKKGASETPKAPFEGSESPLCEDRKGASGDAEAIPYQYIPSHTNTSQCDGAPAPEPPTLEEVKAYFAANCLQGDPELFYAHHVESGWKTPRGLPIENWHGSAMKWHRKEPEFRQSRQTRAEADRLRLERAKPPEERAPVEHIPKAVNSVDWEAEYAKLGGDA